MKHVKLAIFLFCLILVGCHKNITNNMAFSVDNNHKGLFTVNNYASDLSSHIYIYDKHPERIIALWQNSVETLIALGAADKIVAACGINDERYLKEDYLESYRKIPVKSRYILSRESILLLQPDFILGWLFDFSGKANSLGSTFFWEKRHINTYINLMNGADFQAKHTLRDELKYIEDIGKIVGREETAANEIEKIKKKINFYHEKMVDKKPQTVLIISNISKVLTVYTPRTLPGNIVTQLGGVVLGRDQESVGENEFFNYEDVVMLDPDIIFLQVATEEDSVVLSTFYNNPVLKNLRCAKNKKVFCVPFYLMRSPGIRVKDTIDIFAAGLQKNIGDNYEK